VTDPAGGVVRFFDDPDMDFAVRCVLSGVRHGMSEVGETFAAIGEIRDGDADGWLEAFVALGRRCRRDADDARAAGHRYSAWNAALRAANYTYAGAWWAPATRWKDSAEELWAEHRDHWDLAVEHWPSPAMPVRIPHAGTTLPGHWFASPAARGDRSPTVVLVQGLGTPISDVPMTGLDGALARGHHVVVVDGPGQGAALHREGRTLAEGWQGVIASTLDWLETRPEVDPTRVSLLGLGAGALFAASAAADDGARIAALVVDPGVVDLGADAAAAVADAATDRARALLAPTTTEPTGTATLELAVEALAGHRIEAQQLAAIRCPTLVLRGESAGSFCGQSDPFVAALTCPHDVVVLLDERGAGLDEGLDASQVHDAAVFDWLDATLSRRRNDDHDEPGAPR
jgi:pimeloyl-ACP methyl ester carboxylesterase